MSDSRSWLFQDGQWSPEGADVPVDGGSWLHLDLPNSDLATLRWSPDFGADGVAHIGATPRIYFEDPAASEPTDPDREAIGLARWIESELGGDVTALAETIRPLLAEDEEDEWDEQDPNEELDDAELFVEVKVARLFEAVGLPLPKDYWP